jgi:hypothetical protein
VNIRYTENGTHDIDERSGCDTDNGGLALPILGSVETNSHVSRPKSSSALTPLS